MRSPAERAEHVEDRRLDRDVERARRFVAHDDARVTGEGAGDGDALLETAGELARLEGQDPDLLFVTGGPGGRRPRCAVAAPVRLECLADALDNEVEFEIYGEA